MNRLKSMRIQRGLTQLNVQMETGIEQALLSKYETGQRVPTVENLAILAGFFGTSMDYLMGLTDVDQPYPHSTGGS